MLDSMLILLLNKNIDYVLIRHIQYALYAIIILNEHKHLFSTNWNYFNPKNFSFWLALCYKAISTKHNMAAHSWCNIMHEYIVYKQNYKQKSRGSAASLQKYKYLWNSQKTLYWYLVLRGSWKTL